MQCDGAVMRHGNNVAESTRRWYALLIRHTRVPFCAADPRFWEVTHMYPYTPVFSTGGWVCARSVAMTSILTHWGRVTHICVSNLTIIGSDNGLLPDRRQAIIWTNAGLLLIGPLGTNFSEILIAILTFSFKKMRFKVSSAKRRPFCFGLNELIACTYGSVSLSSGYSRHN